MDDQAARNHHRQPAARRRAAGRGRRHSPAASSISCQHHADPVNYRHFVGRRPGHPTFPASLQSAAHFDSEGLIQIGLLLLIATPVARVAMAVVGFLWRSDRLYTVVSLIVLLILAFSLIHAT